MDDAISEAMEYIYRLVDDGDATEDEVTAAMKWHSDFADAWSEYIQEAGS